MQLRVLSVAVATGRAGAVLLIDGKLKHWRLSKRAASDAVQAARWADRLLSDFAPDLVITETYADDGESRKGEHSRELIAAMADVAERKGVQHTAVPRKRRGANKYEEAKALAEQFPEIAAWVPKQPRIWEAEPKHTIYFEALAMAVDVLHEPGDPENALPDR